MSLNSVKKQVMHYEAYASHALVISSSNLNYVKSACKSLNYCPSEINIKKVFTDGDYQWMLRFEYSCIDYAGKRTWFNTDPFIPHYHENAHYDCIVHQSYITRLIDRIMHGLKRALRRIMKYAYNLG